MYKPHMKYYTSPEDTYIGEWGSECQWDDDTDEIIGWYWDMYDGEDDDVGMNPWTWTAAKEQADPPKPIWDHGRVPPDYFKDYVESCPSNLMKFLGVLLKTDLPMVSLNQETPSSPVSCNATGFYPNKAVMFWRKGGEKLLEGVEQTEMLENQDGTFQMSVNLNVTDDMEGKYECVFQLTGVKENIVTKLETRSILSNLSGEDEVCVGCVVATTVILTTVVCLAVIIIIVMVKRYRERHAPDPVVLVSMRMLPE